MVLVDTPVWSLMLRRQAPALNPQEHSLVEELRLLVAAGRAEMLGAVRQELLSGIRHAAQYEALRLRLRAFVDVAQTTEDHERAAAVANQLRSAGIASTPNDVLICATALNRSWSVFSTDRDFQLYQTQLPLKLHPDAS